MQRDLRFRADVPATFWSTPQLRSDGLSERQLCQAVRDGRLLRPRRGHYLPAGTHPEVVAAVALGGRLDCVSLLALLGVFVFSTDCRHVALDSAASRVPSAPPGTVRHWRTDNDDGGRAVSGIVAAVTQAVRCQTPRHSLATLDSVMQRGLLTDEELGRVFDRLPRRYRSLRRLIDRRSESGPETLVRLMLRSLGVSFELQVVIDRVGRVDLVVDGWLIVECDSRAHHSEWADRRRDMRRDLEAAAQGYTIIRPIAEDILYSPDRVLTLLRRVLDHRQGRPADGSAGRRRRRAARAA